MNIGYSRKGLDFLDFFFHLRGTDKPFILTVGYSATLASRRANRSTWPGGIAFPLPETPDETLISCEGRILVLRMVGGLHKKQTPPLKRLQEEVVLGTKIICGRGKKGERGHTH